MLLILFGLPGVGKTYVGDILKHDYGFFFYDGDDSLPDDMLQALKVYQPVTTNMRNRFFQSLIQHVDTLSKKRKNIVIAQTFIKNIYRQQLLTKFPQAKFILIQAKQTIREKRLRSRKEFPIDLSYAKTMDENFDLPLIPHDVVINNADGKDTLVSQLDNLLSK